MNTRLVWALEKTFFLTELTDFTAHFGMDSILFMNTRYTIMPL